MGMLEDILNSIRGPQQSAPNTESTSAPSRMPAPPSSQQSQGMSTAAKVLLGLLALYAAKNVRRDQPSQQTQPTTPAPSSSTTGLTDLLKGPLGGLLTGLGTSAVLNTGLDGLLKQMKNNGLGAASDSWVSHGPNREVSQTDLAKAVGADTLDELANHTGLPRDQVLNDLSQHLPNFVDLLTPNARMPTEQEWRNML